MFLEFLFAVGAAGVNALASVLQRKATLSAPPGQGQGLRLIASQLRRPVFFGGVVGLIAGFLLQAAALSIGQLATVQPILAAELPFTLLIAGVMFKTPFGRREWFAALVMAVGLAVALACAAPSGGKPLTASGLAWGLAVGGTLVLLVLLAVIGWRSPGPRRAALLGIVAGGLFGLTAAFMATATQQVQRGIGTAFTAWQVYAMVCAGAAAVYVLQNALQAGLLAAAQPGVTLADPVLAVVLGVALFGERLRLGWLIAPELLGLAGIAVGTLLLAQSPLINGDQDQKMKRSERGQPDRSGAPDPRQGKPTLAPGA